jgi:hypothetical protein
MSFPCVEKKQEFNIIKGENNEIFSRGDDKDNPPHANIEKSHAVSHPKGKRKSSKKGSQDFGSPRDAIEMEVDRTNVLALGVTFRLHGRKSQYPSSCKGM